MDFFVSFPEVHRGLVDLHTHTHLYFYTCEVPDALLSEPRPKSDTLLRFITFCWSISILNAIFFLALTALVYWPQIIWRGATQPIKSEHLEKQGDCNSSVSDTWTVKEKVTCRAPQRQGCTTAALIKNGVNVHSSNWGKPVCHIYCENRAIT